MRENTNYTICQLFLPEITITGKEKHIWSHLNIPILNLSDDHNGRIKELFVKMCHISEK